MATLGSPRELIRQKVAIANLKQNTIDIVSGDGLKDGGTVKLGSSVSLNINPSDFAGSGLQDSGSQNLELTNNSITLNAGNGLKNGSTASLGGSFGIDIKPEDFTGNTLEVDNSNVVDVNLGKGIIKGSNGSLELDTSESFTFSGEIDFSSDTSINKFLDITPADSEPSAPSTSSVARLFVNDTNPPEVVVKDSTGDKTTLVTLGN